MAQSKAEYPTSDCLASAAIEAKTEAAGVTKANLPVSKAFLLAMFAGAFIAFGGLFFTVFLSDPTLGWGAQRFVGGLAFCLGLVLVLICGAELFTGNSLMVCALKSNKITLVQMLKAWAIVWIGNFAGALFVVFLIGSVRPNLTRSAVRRTGKQSGYPRPSRSPPSPSAFPSDPSLTSKGRPPSRITALRNMFMAPDMESPSSSSTATASLLTSGSILIVVAGTFDVIAAPSAVAAP